MKSTSLNRKMGASQSTEAATDRQMKEVGPFTLRSSEKGAISVLSKIVNQLLTKNNLFDLKDLLGSPVKCSKLFVVVSSTVKKEFQLLKFPDPRNPSHMATLSFLPTEYYPPKYPDSVAARDRACNEITHFLIRLVTLAAACTASISRNENIASLLDISTPQTDSSDIGKYVRDVPAKYDFTNPPLDADSMKYLANVLTQVDADRRPNLYRFGNTYTYIIDVKRGIIYNASASYNEGRTPVFKISMDLLRNQRPLSEVSAPAQPLYGQPILFAQAPVAGPAPGPVPAAGPVPAPGPVPAAGPVPAPGPVPAAGPGYSGSVVTNARPMYTGQPGARSEASSNAYSTGMSQFGVPAGGRRRRTRHHRRHARHTRRRHRAPPAAQRAGAVADYVKCTIEEIAYGDFRECETPSICKRLIFVIDAEANTYDWDAYERFQRDATQAIPPTGVKQFAERIQPTFDSILNNRIMTTEYREKTVLSKDRFKPLVGATEETYKSLVDYKDTMAALPTGSAPAPYRAFLLASRLAGKELTTFFCEDTWAGQYTTATLAYSLLQALYDDGVAGTGASPRSLDAVKTMAKQFTSADVALPAAQSGSDVQDFRNITFAPIPASLDAFCATAAPQKTSAEDDKRVLIAAQQQLRRLYDTHIADMVGIMKKVLFVTTDPAVPGSMIMNLNERFMTDPEGGLVSLEKIIQEARALIGNHFLAVEKQYAGSLLQLGRHRRGVTNVNNPEIAANKLKEASAALV